MSAACTDGGAPARSAVHSTRPRNQPPGDVSLEHTPAPGASSPGGGTVTSDWHIPARASGGIEGYADRAGVLTGQAVTLYVSTSAPRFRVRVFRLGWYGGVQAAQIWLSGPIRGRQQSGPSVLIAATHTMWAHWQPSLTVATAGWPPGQYLLRLETSTGHASYVPLTVRGASAAGRVVIISPVTTWQAYNTWGCCDLYQGADGSFATRARAVSFDRPYDQEDGAGALLYGELGIVVEAERLGLPLDYITDVDLEQDSTVLDGARAVLSVGHDEYWSPTMRAAVERARDAGANLGFFGANAMFRRIRLASTPLGPDRLEINYKVAGEDPLYGHDNPDVTADWPSPPDPRPESTLLGDQYGCNLESTNEAGVIADPSAWMFAGVSVRRGQRLPGLIGSETDAAQPDSYPTPRPMRVIMHSPITCPGGTPGYADASYYVASSGAGVFDAGTISWTCAVIRGCGGRLSGATSRVVRAVTDNLLRVFAAGLAGPQHPVQDNLVQLGIAGSTVR